jgi:hypothetical protein
MTTQHRHNITIDNPAPKMDNFSKKCIFLGEKAKVGGGHFV